MESKIRELIGTAVIGIDENSLLADATFKSQGIDSLDTYAIIAAVQEHYNIEITDADSEKCVSIAGIISLLKEYSISE